MKLCDMYSLLHLASLTEADAFVIHPRSCAYLFYLSVVVHCVDAPHFIQSPVEGHLVCFRFLSIMNKVVISIGIQVFV